MSPTAPASPLAVHRRVRRPGFTLVELMTSVVLFLGLMAIVVPFFRQQARSIEQQGGLLDAVQAARFAATQIDRALRAAGGETGQPLIVQASPMAITFNVNLVSRIPGDPRATYYNPDADSLATEGWNPIRAKALPRATKTYPAAQYADQAGNPSTAETISFWLSRDLTAPRTDMFTLWRRSNDRDSVVVARNIVVADTVTGVFRYWRGSTIGNLTQVPVDSLPLYWDRATKWADSIRVVDISFSALHRDARTRKDVLRTIATSTRVANAGLLQARGCGTEPLEPKDVTTALVGDSVVTDTLASPSDSVRATRAVRVTWKPSPEEAAGERDVTAYVIVRQVSGGSDWETLANTPASGLQSYFYDDFTFSVGDWVYGVVAQDCNPSYSPRVTSTIKVTLNLP